MCLLPLRSFVRCLCSRLPARPLTSRGNPICLYAALCLICSASLRISQRSSNALSSQPLNSATLSICLHCVSAFTAVAKKCSATANSQQPKTKCNAALASSFGYWRSPATSATNSRPAVLNYFLADFRLDSATLAQSFN